MNFGREEYLRQGLFDKTNPGTGTQAFSEHSQKSLDGFRYGWINSEKVGRCNLSGKKNKQTDTCHPLTPVMTVVIANCK